MSEREPDNDASDIEVHSPRPEEAGVIADFNHAMALETENKRLDRSTLLSGVRAVLENEDLGFYLVARIGEDVVGCLLITTEWSDWRNGLFWWIQSVYVAPESRGKGVFSALYSHVSHEARSRSDVCGLRLYVEKENERARRTYLRLGMTETDYRLLEIEF